MTHLHLDFETYSEVDIKQAGAYRYAEDPSTEALMLAWAIDDGPVQIWDIDQDGQMAGFPDQLFEMFQDPDTLILAFNATFERLILKHCLGIEIPPERFRCVQVRSYGLAFTGGLDAVAEQFNLGIAKDPRGQALINRFSKPQPANHKVRRWTAENDPEGWEEFKAYCIKDVEVERQLWKKCEPYHFPEQEWKNYFLSEKINDRGVPIDLKLVDISISTAKKEKARIIEEMRKLMPGVGNPNSGPQLIEWLKGQGCMIFNTQKETIVKTLEKFEGQEPVASALNLKQQLAKTSTTKWTKFKKMVCRDGRIHGMFQFGGASRTLRWAGRGVQLQNLPRGGNATYDPETGAEVLLAGGHAGATMMYGNVMGLLSDLIRAAITVPDGVMNVSDLSSIESRVLGWVSDCKVINEAFAARRCTYRMFATKMFGVKYEDVTGEQRKLSKPPVLGGGYKLGGKGLVGYAASMGITITEEEGHKFISVLRADWPEVVEFWNWCKAAVFHTTQTGQEYPGPHGLKTFAHGEFLCIRLPSSRNLYYHRPKILQMPAPWNKEQMIDQFTYMGTDRHRGNKWCRIKAHEGGITENCIQAIARDVLVEWMHRADRAGFNLFLHVHDEQGSEDSTDRLEEMNELIRQPISWAPGLLLDAGGYTARRYKKD